ncbi:MAG: hypothetical protein BWY07_00739 [Candidatus Hydrogenedentes bacterium ADurb.Bin170]|nr:MAG: hypothetical protein BWY07_00739 [Candidatus Hydrogenedentes bacterium ADurb.Bin170]
MILLELFRKLFSTAFAFFADWLSNLVMGWITPEEDDQE